MRAELIRESGRVIKKADASSYLFEHAVRNLAGYREWLHSAGFKTPDTTLRYADSQIIFEQELIDADSSIDVESVIGKIRRLNFDTYGMDSNPHNFLGNGDIYFVDFFPLLTRDTLALEQQFDYSSQEASQRYFTLENILMFYIVRVFKEDAARGVECLRLVNSDLLAAFDEVLPREKVRLLRALQLNEQGHILEYPQVYADTKKITSIVSAENRELQQRLSAF